MPLADRKYDIVLYGASGFTGRQTVEYCRQFAPPGLRWAIAGRNRSKLDTVNPAGVDVLVANGEDDEALNRLAVQTRIVASTAGPFSLYGTKLVAACVGNRTHYCDITGETPWIRRLIDRHHARAAADGTRIVGCNADVCNETRAKKVLMQDRIIAKARANSSDSRGRPDPMEKTLYLHRARGLGFRKQALSGPKTVLGPSDLAQIHTPSSATNRNSEAIRMAYVPALFDPAAKCGD